MDKLELKYIAPYLPYGLRGNLINPEYYKDVINGELFRIETGLTTKHRTPDPMVIVNDTEDCLFYFKPILRPLSDLINHKIAKEIFDDDNWLTGETFLQTVSYFTNSNNPLDFCFTQYDWEKLYENHFDVFSLIESGLAIDINTINP